MAFEKATFELGYNGNSTSRPQHKVTVNAFELDRTEVTNDQFAAFVAAPPPGLSRDPVPQRGAIALVRTLEEALPDADAVMTLRLQKERMQQQLLTSLDAYHRRYGISHRRLELCGRPVPVLHPGPVTRGVELAGELLDDPARSLVEEQVRNGIPIRMALLYLLAAAERSPQVFTAA